MSLVILDSVVRVNKRYHPQTLFEECKHIIKKNKTEKLINDDLDLSSSDNEFDHEFNNGFDNEADNGFDSESDD